MPVSEGEFRVARALQILNIQYEEQYCINNTRFRFDFLVEEFNAIIEFDGQQHFKWVKMFYKTEEVFKEKQKVDAIKTLLAIRSGYKIIRIDHTYSDRSIDKLVTFIKNALLSSTDMILSNENLYSYLKLHISSIESSVEIIPELKDAERIAALFGEQMEDLCLICGKSNLALIRCGKCCLELEHSRFGKSGSSHSPWCKTCNNNRIKKWRDEKKIKDKDKKSGEADERIRDEEIEKKNRYLKGFGHYTESSLNRTVRENSKQSVIELRAKIGEVQIGLATDVKNLYEELGVVRLILEKYSSEREELLQKICNINRSEKAYQEFIKKFEEVEEKCGFNTRTSETICRIYDDRITKLSKDIDYNEAQTRKRFIDRDQRMERLEETVEKQSKIIQKLLKK